MKLDARALALTAALVWAAAVFLVGMGNLIWPGYGTPFLELVASLYPGYRAERSLWQVIVGTGYALVDGAVSGFIFAWLYNLLAGKRGRAD